MLARLLDRAAVAALFATLAWAPLAFGSTYGWGASGLRLGVAITLLLAAAAFTLWAPAEGEELPLARILTPAAVALALYLLLATLSHLLSPAPYVSQQALMGILTAALGFYLALGLLRTPLRRGIFLVLALGVAAAMATYGLAQWFGVSLTPTLGGRVSSFFYNPNHYAGFLDLATPLALAVALFGQRVLARLAAGAITAALLANLLLSYSRGGWVAVAIACALLSLLWVGMQLRKGRYLRVLISASAAVVLTFTGWQLLERFAPQVQTQLEARYARLARDLTQLEDFDRIIILRAGVQAIPEAPLLGVGPGNFISVITRYRPPSVDSMADSMMHRFVNYAHNDYLQVAIETGLLALAAFLGFWLWSLLAAWRVPAAERLPLPLRAGLTFGLVAILIHGLVDGNLTVITSNALWAFIFAGVLHTRVPTAEEAPFEAAPKRSIRTRALQIVQPPPLAAEQLGARGAETN
jgi:O-antigen ligase